MSDTATTETPVLGKVRSRHIKMARAVIHHFLKTNAGEAGELSVSRRKLALLVRKRLKAEGFDLDDSYFAARKALAQLVQRGELEIIPVPHNEHGMPLPSIYRLKGE